MRTVLLLTAAVLASGAVAAATPGHRHAAGGPGHASEVTRTIRVEAYDLAFSPKSLTVKSGETVRFVVTNSGKLVHEFVLGTAAEQARHRAMMARMPNLVHDHPSAVTVKPGESRTLIWRFGQAGGLEFACNVPGHAEAGMRGRITIEM